MTSPLQQYQKDQQQQGFCIDSEQAEAVNHLQRLYEDILRQQNAAADPKNWSKRIAGKVLRKSKKAQPIRGLYFWGGVGRGKTYLMDIFYQCLPFENKLRTHFHRFMRDVHKRLTENKGAKNPLTIVAKELALETKVICFDEFFVTDITDAMILGQLLEQLFERGVVLVATSNIEPARLYENGLQRQRFLPAIALLEQQTTVVNVDGGVDYRLRTLTQATLYHWPLDDQANVNLAKGFNALAPDMAAPKNGEEAVLDATGADSQERPVKGAAGSVSVNGRKFNYIKKTEGVIWFSFDQLCAMPRSQNDYLELALEFHSLIVSDVPCLKAGMEDQARRFVNLVDVCYDANLKLILSAQVPLLELYNGGSLDFVFQRTLSRLQEMQSVEYLARAHVPA